MKEYPIVVLISGNGGNLQAMIDAIGRGAPYTIKAVISDKADAYGLGRAQRANIPTEVLLVKDFASRTDYDKALLAINGEFFKAELPAIFLHAHYEPLPGALQCKRILTQSV